MKVWARFTGDGGRLQFRPSPAAFQVIARQGGRASAVTRVTAPGSPGSDLYWLSVALRPGNGRLVRRDVIRQRRSGRRL